MKANVIFCVLAAMMATVAVAEDRTVGQSLWGPEDQLGRLNMMTKQSKMAILSRISTGDVYDLSVEYFTGMPGWFPAGDPRYAFWMTHTPKGNVVADPMKVGKEMNEHVSYTGSAFSMYAHTGTHIDALNHFGLNGKVYNEFSADEHLGDHGWTKTGAETIPPIVARGVLIDVAAYKGVNELSAGYRIEQEDIVAALEKQKVKLAKGDVVLIRTGRMQSYEDTDAYLENPPGLGMDGARYLVEKGCHGDRRRQSESGGLPVRSRRQLYPGTHVSSGATRHSNHGARRAGRAVQRQGLRICIYRWFPQTPWCGRCPHETHCNSYQLTIGPVLTS